MSDGLTAAIDRARWLLANATNAAMATVNEDGSPHNTPYFFMRSDDLTELYWGSHPESQHSHNILRDSRLFVVLYEADKGGGLYMSAEHGRIAEDDELTRALDVHNALRKASGREPHPASYYSGTAPQRLWLAHVSNVWVNHNIKDENGHIAQDVRRKIDTALLTK